MQFNSIEFLYGFLPVFMVIYLLSQGIWRHAVLTVGSLAFYWFATRGNVLAISVLIAATVGVYFAGRLIEKYPQRWLLSCLLVLMGGGLTLFKVYRGGIFLAAGMSFYLFQMAAYLIDIYRGRMLAEPNFLRCCSQMVMFPKLLSGPLVSPRSLRVQAGRAKPTYDGFHEGLQELILGLGLKVLLANRLGGLWSQAAVIGYESISVPFAWMAILAYVMRLYFDFYGYSLMAVGLGKMLGYDLPQNFLEPYASRSVSEFYRRWHATLGAWFKEYIYIPLGGNRRGAVRTIFNLAVVWLVTGLWHGIGGNYLIWAGFIFLCIVMERLWLGKLLNKTRILPHVYVIFVIILSWVPFAIGDWNQMVMFFGRLFGLMGHTANGQDYLVWGQSYFALLFAGVVLATPMPKKLWKKVQNHTLTDIVLVILFWVVIKFIATAAQDPFLYFQY